MSPSTNQTSAEVAEINSLSARLSTAKSNRARQIEAINRLKTRQANEYAFFCGFRDEIDRKDLEAQVAYNRDQLADYERALQEIGNIELQRTRALREWSESGSQIQKAYEELMVLDQEISELERVLDEREVL